MIRTQDSRPREGGRAVLRWGPVKGPHCSDQDTGEQTKGGRGGREGLS